MKSAKNQKNLGENPPCTVECNLVASQQDTVQYRMVLYTHVPGKAKLPVYLILCLVREVGRGSKIFTFPNFIRYYLMQVYLGIV